MKLLQTVQGNLDCSSSAALVVMLSLQDILQNYLLNYRLAGQYHVAWKLAEVASRGVQQTPEGWKPQLIDHP